LRIAAATTVAELNKRSRRRANGARGFSITSRDLSQSPSLSGHQVLEHCSLAW
jgi:hypothetical protein